MLLKSFCGCLGLQAGVVITAFSLIQIAIVILISNLHLIPERPKSLLFMSGFLLVMLATAVTMVCAAYQESRKVCLFALFLNVILIAIFIVGSGLSFTDADSLTDYVCDDDRCPESLWCAPLRFRIYGNDTEEYFTTESGGTGVTVREPEVLAEEPGSGEDPALVEDPGDTTKTTEIRPLPGSEDTPASDAPTTTHFVTAGSVVKTTAEPATPSGHAAISIAILLFVINLTFFIFCALVVFSYSQELNYFFKLHVF